MKTLKFFAAFAIVATLLTVESCKKAPQPGNNGDKPGVDQPVTPDEPVIPEYPVKYTVTVDDIKLNYARISITITGDEESAGTSEVVRYVVVKESDAPSVTDYEALQTYITRNGEPITLPYNRIQRNLDEASTYLVGVLSYDADINVNGYMVKRFNTLTMSDLPNLGDESGAGNLTENPLQ